MMQTIRTILTLMILTDLGAAATSYFLSQGDMCTATASHHCPNNPLAVKNLQIALLSDKNLKVKIKPDGVWGTDTQAAVKMFQSHYRIKPADGWVGRSTKAKMDAVYHSRPFSFAAHGDICEENDGQECPNDYAAVRNLQIVLNVDRNLTFKEQIDVDGIWGKKTFQGVMAFQKAYGMRQVDGWIGKGSKPVLDRITRGLVFPGVAKRYRAAPKAKSTFRAKSGSYAAFKHSNRYPKSYSVYRNNALLRKARKGNTKIVVDVSQQRIRLYVGSKVAIDSPCTTGARHKIEPNTRTYRDKHTPMGHFRITEKLADKRSSIFGKLYRGKKMVWRGDRRKYHGPKARYVGASLKNWMRLTSSGIGLHGSKYVKRYPATNGCVRIPFSVVRQIFKHVKVGTRVNIVP